MSSSSSIWPRPMVYALEQDDAVDEGPDRGRIALRRPLSGEVEQVLDDAPRARRLLDQQVGVGAQVVGQGRVVADELAEAEDRGQRVVELVGDARHELAGGLHLLGLDELGLEAVLVGQVAHAHAASRRSPSVSMLVVSTSCGKRVPSRRVPTPRRARRGTRWRGRGARPTNGSASSAARRPNSHSRSAPNRRVAASLASTTVPSGRCHEERVGRLLEERSIALLGGQQALAQPEVLDRDGGHGGDPVEGAAVEVQVRDRPVEVGRDAAHHLVVDPDRDGRVGGQAGLPGEVDDVHGHDAGLERLEERALARPPAAERRAHIRPGAAQPVRDRRDGDRRSARPPRCRRPGRPGRRPCPAAPRAALMSWAERSASCSMVVTWLPTRVSSSRARRRTVVARSASHPAQDLLDQAGVLQAARDVGGDQQDDRVGGQRPGPVRTSPGRGRRSGRPGGAARRAPASAHRYRR